MTGSFPTVRRPRRLALAAAGLVVLAGSMGGSAASPAPSVDPDACFEYGREIRDLAWDATGSHLAVLSWYHRDSRVDVIDWPSMAIRQVDSSPYAYIDHGESVAVDTDGTVWWSGYEAEGPRITRARPGSGPETWWPAEQSSRLRAVRQLYRTPDGLELNGAIERGKATYSRHVWIDDTDPATARHDKTRLVGQFYVTPGGRTRLFTGNEDLPFGSIEVQAQRGSSVIQIDQGGQDLSLSPDGRHILWAGYEQLMTRPVDGSEAVRIADAYRTASVGPHGIIAHPARSQRFADLWDWDDGTRFDPPLLPDRLCFTLAPWASIETPIPAMPPGETVAIEEPVRPLPGVVRSLSALLPTKVDGHDVSWSGAVLLESPRDSSSFEFPRMVWPQALPFAAREPRGRPIRPVHRCWHGLVGRPGRPGGRRRCAGSDCLGGSGR